MMSNNQEYQPINCDDYDTLESACQECLILTLTLRDGELLQGEVKDLQFRKSIEYLIIIHLGALREIRLDYIESFEHPTLGKVTIR